MNMKLYLAEGDCPIQLRGYREYDLNKLFDFSKSEKGPTLPGFQFKNPQKHKAKESYILSFVAAFDGNYQLAFERLKESLKEDFVPEAALVAGLVNLRCGGELNQTFSFLENAQSTIETKMKQLGKEGPPPEYFEVLLYQARTLDLKGERAEALKLYKKISEHPGLKDQNIARLAKKANRYHFGKLKRLIMPYSTYIPFE
jgi:hypothetical protein